MLLWIIIANIFLANLFGVIFHYTHKRKTRSLLLHVFSSVNESTWEHLKLAFTPMLFLTFLNYFLLRNTYPNVIESNLYGLLMVILLIPLLYYPIRFFLKREVVFVSIGIFILSVILGYIGVYNMLLKEISLIGETISFTLLVLISFLFGIFTFFPPKIFLFKDPITGKYGHPKE